MKRELTKQQRQWVLERDNNQCQFYTYFPKRGLVRCPNTTNLHVHHIKPWRWLIAKFGFVKENPSNLITLCKRHHIGFIHKDMDEALHNYHYDKDSIKKVFVERDKLVQKQIPYWVQRWDDFLKWLAKEATMDYIRKHPFPE